MRDFLSARWADFLAALQSAARADAELAAFSANADCRFRLSAGARAADFVFVPGSPLAVSESHAENPCFALEAPAEVWAKFFSSPPPAPYHGIYAMKMRVPEFRVTGSELALAQSISLVRRVLEIGRCVANGGHGPAAGRAPVAKARTREAIRGGYVWIEYEGRPSRIYYEEAGAGRDLLCLHTAGSDSRQFYRLLNDSGLAAGWRMVAFDLPWHGKSLPPEGAPLGAWDLTTERYVEAIEAVIKTLDLRRPVLLGSSMAGQICLEMALRWGERLGGVIACEASERIAGREVPWTRNPQVNESAFVPEWVHGLMAPQSPSERAREVWWEYSQGGYGVFWGDIRFYGREWDARERVGRIDTRKCPVIMLTGEYDYSCTPEISRATAAKIPGADFEVMRGMGHFPMAENPELFLEYLRPALAKLRDR
ncbi:MAG TPA: alpha/beta hydrolase [Burkholderiales bacterium]|nr:alpha/beta hydrolase [Burkholderiales bacterium]